MKIRAVYEGEVLKPLQKLDLPENVEVRLTIEKTFAGLLDELGEIEAKEDIDSVISDLKRRTYYG
jgi:predicted DNA-binding antitoxin AbrB/MazE fold protein